MKKFGVDFDSDGGALTLNPSEVGGTGGSWSCKYHEDGWVIGGFVSEDWYEWVNDFTAYHPDYGTVRGNFEKEVYADSEEGFKHFMEHHAPQAWDYGDI